MARCVQNVGMVRYKAFQDMSGSVFLPCAAGCQSDGIIITNIFGGSNCSVYSKPVKDGKSDFTVPEEKQALRRHVRKSNKIPLPYKKPSIPKLIASALANNVLAKH